MDVYLNLSNGFFKASQINRCPASPLHSRSGRARRTYTEIAPGGTGAISV